MDPTEVRRSCAFSDVVLMTPAHYIRGSQLYLVRFEMRFRGLLTGRASRLGTALASSASWHATN